MAELFHGLDVALEDLRRIGKGGDGAVDAAFAQQVQGREGRAVGEVGDVLRVAAGELVLRVQAGDLEDAFVAEVLQ